MGNLTGLTALVFGAGSKPGDNGPVGNGQAIAQRLSREGAHVAVADVSLSRSVATVSGFSRPGLALEADALSVSQCQDVVHEAAAWRGRLDTLVCNVGVSGSSSFEHQSVDEWEKILNINLRSHWILSQAALPYLRKSPNPSIVYVSSIAGQRSSGKSLAYEVSKAGVIALARHVGTAVAALGIRANCVAPGLIESAMISDSAYWSESSEMATARANASPMRRQGRPDEVAAAVAFLVSLDAGYITATCLNVDGGRTSVAPYIMSTK